MDWKNADFNGSVDLALFAEPHPALRPESEDCQFVAWTWNGHRKSPVAIMGWKFKTECAGDDSGQQGKV
jgi:hypothetical protein